MYGGAMTGLFGRPRTEIAPGAVHLPGWLTIEEQRHLVTACREWGRPPAGMRHTPMPSAGGCPCRPCAWAGTGCRTGTRRTRTTSTGRRSSRSRAGSPTFGRRAVADAYDEQAQATSYRPDVALINFYDEHAKMGMHADRDERSPSPVVSLSLGSACVFRFGNAESRGRPWHDVTLESGDLFVFGGEARLAFHGVMKTVPATERPDIGMPAGRLNITLRESGLT